MQLPAVLNMYFKVFLLLDVLSIALSDIIRERQSLILGDTFPSCVDVAAIYPPPFSFITPSDTGQITFNITFSKPVTEYSYKSNSPDVFLTSNLADFTKVGSVYYRGYPGSSKVKRMYTFNFTKDELKIYKYVYTYNHYHIIHELCIHVYT